MPQYSDKGVGQCRTQDVWFSQFDSSFRRPVFRSFGFRIYTRKSGLGSVKVSVKDHPDPPLSTGGVGSEPGVRPTGTGRHCDVYRRKDRVCVVGLCRNRRLALDSRENPREDSGATTPGTSVKSSGTES